MPLCLLRNANAREMVLEGWYTSRVVLPDKDNEVIWLDFDGHQVVGMYDRQGRWLTVDGRQLCCSPMFWRYANENNPDTREDEVFSRWVARYSQGRFV